MKAIIKKNGSIPAVNTYLDDFFSRDIFDLTDKNFSALGSDIPYANLKETDTTLEVELAVPGMKKEDFKIEIENNMLKISSKKEIKKGETEEKENYVRKEFSYHSFYRSFYLPHFIDENKIEASYTNGILQVIITKKEGGQKNTSQRININ
jgi:HSP20 family protein